MIREKRRSAAWTQLAAVSAALSLAACSKPAGPGEAAATTSASIAAASAPAEVITDAGADADAPEARKPRDLHGKLLCFGDSITQAEWAGKIAPEERWVTQLGKKSPAISVVNAGKNGRKTSALDELGKALDGNADAAMVLIFLGVNDMLHGTAGVVDKATTNMGKMIDLTRARLPRAEIVILAPTHVNVEKLSPFFKAEGLGPDTAHFMRSLSRAYAELAKKKGTRFISLARAVSPENLEDGVHANGKGQIQIADAVWKGLQRR